MLQTPDDKPTPDARNTAWPWNVAAHTHYIKLADGRLFYVRRVTRADIDTLSSEIDLMYLAVYAASATEIATHDGVKSCLAFVRTGALKRLARLHGKRDVKDVTAPTLAAIAAA